MPNNHAIAGCTAILALEAIERDVDGPSDLAVVCGGERGAGLIITRLLYIQQKAARHLCTALL